MYWLRICPLLERKYHMEFFCFVTNGFLKRQNCDVAKMGDHPYEYLANFMAI